MALPVGPVLIGRRTAAWLGFAALVAIGIAIAWCGGDGARREGAERAGERAPSGRQAADRRGATAATAPRRAELRGRVIRPGGAPAAGAAVRLRDRAVVAGADGEFSFGAQPLGGHVLEAQHEDDVSPTVRHELTAAAAPVTLVLVPGAAVRVEVVRARDGAPIAGAVVELAAGDPDFDARAWRREVAGADGVAVFRGVVATANHAVIARAAGFVDGFANLIEGGAGDRRRWATRIALDEGAILAGRAVDERGAPVAGATVGFRPGEDEPTGVGLFSPFVAGGRRGTTTTADDGTFRLSAQPAGRGCLVATHPDLLLGERCGVAASLGAESGGHEIVLGDGGAIRGVVVDADGAPVAGATVLVTMRGQELMPRFYEDHRFVTTTDGGGGFALTGVDRAPVVVYAHAADASSDLVDVDLTASALADGVELRLVHAGAIAGVVTEEDGTSVPWATVRFRPDHLVDEGITGDVPARWTMTRTKGAVRADDQGRFRIPALPEGAYALEADRPAPTSVPTNYGTARVEVRTGQEARLVMPGLGGLRGRVVGARGPIGVSLAIGGDRLDESMYPPPRRFADGRFELDAVPAHGYSVQISGDGIATWYSDGPVRVAAGAVTDLGTIRVQRGVARTGIVIGRDGAPVGGAQVILVVDGVPEGRTSDPDGSFEIPALAEDATLRARATTETGASPWLAVGARQARVELVLTEAVTGALDGVLVGADPLAGRLVAAVDVDGASPEDVPPRATATTGAGGRFAIAALPPGTYHLWLLDGAWAAGGSIQVRGGETARAVVRTSATP